MPIKPVQYLSPAYRLKLLTGLKTLRQKVIKYLRRGLSFGYLRASFSIAPVKMLSQLRSWDYQGLLQVYHGQPPPTIRRVGLGYLIQ